MTPAPPDGETRRRALADLPSVSAILAPHGISAEKRFGQHFLFDLNLCRKIARLAEPLEEATVIEVGPGPGGLTRALLEAGAQVVAIEKDPRFIPVLEEIGAAAPGRLVVLGADALAIDESALLASLGRDLGAVIVANLPYNVGTALFVKWLTGAWRPRAMTLMFQKEVARRIVSPPGGAEYGRLSVLAQALCDVRIVAEAPARAFTPPPKVDSAVIQASPRVDRPGDLVLEALQIVTAAAFGQRRKMLRSSLRSLGGDRLCAAAGLDPTVRAEDVDVNGFLRMAEASLTSRSSGA